MGKLGSTAEKPFGRALEEQGGYDLGVHVNVQAGRAFCFTHGRDEDAIRRAHEQMNFPYDSITEARQVTGVDLRPEPGPAKK